MNTEEKDELFEEYFYQSHYTSVIQLINSNHVIFSHLLHCSLEEKLSIKIKLCIKMVLLGCDQVNL